MHVRRELGGDESKDGKYDPTMSHRRGYIKHDGCRNGYEIVIKVREVVHDEKPFEQAVSPEITI